METTWARVLVFLASIAFISAQTPSPSGIKFFVDRVGGRSCDQVCEEQGRVCQGTNQAIPSDALPAFREAGVDCQFDAFHDTTGDAWQFSGDPKYGIGGLDDGICKGFKNVPRTIFCDAKPAVNYGRLCPCRKKLPTQPTTVTTEAITTTEATTTEATTTEATTTEATTTEATTTEATTTEATTTAEATTTTKENRLQNLTPAVAEADATSLPISDGLTVLCSRDSMVAILHLKELPKIDPNTMTLLDSSCKPSFVNSTHAFIETPLDGCGTTSNATKDYLTYYNSIKVSRKKKNDSDAIIIRDFVAVINFKCSYDKRVILSVVSFSPRKKIVYTRTGNWGNFTFTMDIYKTSQYKAVFDYPAEVDLNQQLYLQVKAESLDSQLVLFAQKCFATPSEDVADKNSYTFINKGCGTDITLEYKYDNQSATQRFNIAAFRFLSETTDEVYLHCELIVCRKSDKNSVCAKGCESGGKSRKRRAIANSFVKQTLTVGPVDLMQVQAASNVASGSATTTIAIIAGTLALLVILLVAAIVVVHRRRPHDYKCKPVLLVQE